jgi:hypothetical protein
MADRDSLTQERLRYLLHYDPITGVFTRLVKTSSRFDVGDIAGSPHNQGYVSFRVDSTLYLAHRLAWFYVHGTWPRLVDHRDTIRHHNWIDNLRDATYAINAQNKRVGLSTSTSRFLGVSWCAARGQWQSKIKVDRRTIFLGRFDVEEDAAAAYVAAKRIWHPGCTL